MTTTVKLNVGGRVIETAKSTLNISGGPFFEKLLGWEAEKTRDDSKVDKPIFIDRDPDAFTVALNFLRTGVYFVPKSVPEALVVEVFEFLQLSKPKDKSKKRKKEKICFEYNVKRIHLGDGAGSPTLFERGLNPTLGDRLTGWELQSFALADNIQEDGRKHHYAWCIFRKEKST